MDLESELDPFVKFAQNGNILQESCSPSRKDGNLEIERIMNIKCSLPKDCWNKVTVNPRGMDSNELQADPVIPNRYINKGLKIIFRMAPATKPEAIIRRCFSLMAH